MECPPSGISYGPTSGDSSVTPNSIPLYYHMHRRYYLWLTGFEGAQYTQHRSLGAVIAFRRS